MTGVSDMFFTTVDPLPLFVQPDADWAPVQPDPEICPAMADIDVFYAAAGKLQ